MNEATPDKVQRIPLRTRGINLKILLVEDNPGDVRLIREMLSEGSSQVAFRIENVTTLAEGVEKMTREKYDAVLLDLGLPDSRGLETFYAFHSSASQAPIIVLTVLHDEEAALEAVRNGAQDYLIKGRIESDLLTRGILYSIERKQTEGTLRGRTLEAESAQIRAETYFDFLAHDIANIISPIMAYAELITLDPNAPTGTKNKAAKIVEQSRRASSFILGLRGLDEAERIPPEEMEVVDLSDVLPMVEERTRLEYPEKRLTINIALPKTERIRVAGGKHIVSILEGILENSANYADKDEVMIDVSVKPVGDGSGKEEWHIEVTDYGPGIPDDLKSLFLSSPNPSERFRKGMSRGVASSLLIYSAVLRHLNGRMWIEDRVPEDFTRGAKIVIRLPRGA